jgi:hypothetical protein
MIPVALVALVALPFLLIGVALFEEVVVGTNYITSLYRTVGLFAPLDWLLDNTYGPPIK